MKNLIIISLLFLFSCAKEGKNIYIEGRVVNPVTGEGIPNVKLLLKKVVHNADLTTESKVKQEAISDQDGNFILKHNGSLAHNYVVSVEFLDEGYHFVGWKDESGQTIGDYKLYVTKGEVMNVDLELSPYVKLRVWHRNLNCFNNNDSIHIFRHDQFNYTDGDYKRYGCIIDEPSGYITLPMGNVNLNWIVYRENSSPQSFSDVIDLSITDSTTYIVEY